MDQRLELQKEELRELYSAQLVSSSLILTTDVKILIDSRPHASLLVLLFQPQLYASSYLGI